MSKFDRTGPTYRDFVAALGRFASGSENRDIGSVFPRVVLAWGESDYLLGRTADFIREQWHGLTGVGATSVEAGDLNAERFREAALQTSLFDSDSLYVVRRAEKRADLPKLLSLIPAFANKEKVPHQSLGGHFLLLYNKAKVPVDLRREVSRINGVEIPCVEPGPGEINRFLSALARKYHIDLNADAIALMLECFGRDLVRLDNEIRILSLLFPNRAEPLTVADIAPHVGLIREDEIFALDNLLVGRQWSRAQLFLTELLNRGESPIAVLGILARHCRNALHIGEAGNVRGGSDAGALASRLRLPFSVVRSYTSYVGSMKASTFRQALAACSEADIKLKSARISDGMVLNRILETLESGSQGRFQ